MKTKSKQLAVLLLPVRTGDKELEKEQVEVANAAAELLMRGGLRAMSIMATSDQLAAMSPLIESDWVYYHDPFLDRADVIYILCLPGWEDDELCKRALAYGEGHKKPIVLISVENL